MAIDCYCENGGSSRVAGSWLHTACGRWGEVILVLGLIVDGRYGAGAAGAERILSRGIGVAADDSDVRERPVKARDAVEGPAVVAAEKAHRAVSRDAQIAGHVQDVTR